MTKKKNNYNQDLEARLVNIAETMNKKRDIEHCVF